MRVCLCSVPDNGIRPVYLHREVTRTENTYKNRRRSQVDKKYVWGLQYSPRKGRVEPVRYFGKDIDSRYLVVTDDIHSHLMSKSV